MSMLRPSVPMRGGVKPPEVAEAAEAMSEERGYDLFKKMAALAIILITLFGALVEYLHEQDSARADETVVEAQRLALGANDSTLVADGSFAIGLENLTLAERERASGASTNQQLTNPPPQGWSASEIAAMQAQEKSLALQAALVQGRNTIDPAGKYGPEADGSFPAGYIAFVSSPARLQMARSELVRTEHTQWVNRALSYLAILTMLAVAVYLLGLALTINERTVRRIMAGVSVLMVGIGVFWTVGTQRTEVQGIDDKALTAYVSAREILDRARSRGDFQQAHDYLNIAIDRQPNFARAYVDRSFADFMLGAPEGDRSALYSPGFIDTSNVPWGEQALTDLKAAEGFGYRSKLVYENMADDIFILWADGGPASLDDALARINTALQLDPHDAAAYFFKGDELLALGHDAEARTAYAKGIRELPQQYAIASLDVSVGLSELEIIANKRSASGTLDKTIRELKESLIAALYPSSYTHVPTNVVAAAGIDQPATLAWSAQMTGYDQATDNVVIQWYYRHATGTCPEPSAACGTWINMYSGYPGKQSCESNKIQFECIQVLDGNNVRGYDEILKLGAGSECLSDGDYRVEVYVNGSLVSRSPVQSVRLGWDEIRAFRIPDLGLSFCGSGSWTSMPNGVLGMLRAFQSADRTSGYLLARLEHPSDRTTSTDTLVENDLRRVITQLGKGLLPAGLNQYAGGAAQSFDGTESPLFAAYSYPGGGEVVVYAGFAGSAASGFSTGLEFDRATIVGAVWGTPDFVQGHADELIGSLTPTWQSAFAGGAKVELPPAPG